MVPCTSSSIKTDSVRRDGTRERHGPSHGNMVLQVRARARLGRIKSGIGEYGPVTQAILPVHIPNWFQVSYFLSYFLSYSAYFQSYSAYICQICRIIILHIYCHISRHILHIQVIFAYYIAYSAYFNADCADSAYFMHILLLL